jgi:tRNA A-37 threonylcarbamoyl transferase component Bud32
MHTFAHNQLQQIIEQSEDITDDLDCYCNQLKIYKKNHEKEIVSFFDSRVQQRVVLKIAYVKGNIVQKFFRRWEKSLCKREFKMSHHFLRKGFTVPGPIFCGEERRFGSLQKGYYLSYEITDSILFTEYLALFDGEQSIEAVKEKRKLLQALGEYIGSMHAQSMYHGILMPHHILLKKLSDTYIIYLIDLEYSKIYKKPKRKIMVKELRKLNKYTKNYYEKGCLTRTDKLRFLVSYCRANQQVSLSDFINGYF